MVSPKGILVSIGGAEKKGDEEHEAQKQSEDFLENGILKKIVESMHKPQPVIEVLTTATSHPLDTFDQYKSAFSALGCIKVGHLDIRDRIEANDEVYAERLRSCDGVMITGGDQERLCAVLGRSMVHRIMKERYYAEPFVVAGTSAGAAAMSSTMINGGKVQRAYLKGEVRLSMGLGFINEVIIDTHFDARGRFARLAQAVATQPAVTGIGLSEDTGVIITKGKSLQAIGSSGVTIIQGHNLVHSNIGSIKAGDPISIATLDVSILACPDKFDLHGSNMVQE
jgi:cyanophycinase